MFDIKQYLDTCIIKLNLKNWEIDLVFDSSLNTDGSTLMLFNDYKAVIKIKSGLSIESTKLTLLHELIHLIHRDELDIALECINDEFQNKLYLRYHERSIEQLAKILYRLIN